MYKRILKIEENLKKKSFFLFGPRSTGKSTLIKSLFKKEQILNLLSSDLFLSFSTNPLAFKEAVNFILKKTNDKLIIIDEIQLLPTLLNEVHELIEEKNLTFLMTGSSARKLRRAGVNLLAGRAWQANLFPLVSAEIDDFNLDKYLLYGGLPQVYNAESPIEELDAYINIYLKEEIKEEALVQNFLNFSRFLKTASFESGELINYAKLASDSGIPASSVKQYFEILEDTFLGFLLPPFRNLKKRKTIATSKFYFFDVGVANYLKGIKILTPKSVEYGKAFEHFILMEIRAYLSYTRVKEELSFFRTRDQVEVDFLIGEEVAIEIKASEKITSHHLKGLKVLMDENLVKKYYLVSFDQVERITEEEIIIINYKNFLKDLWSKKII